MSEIIAAAVRSAAAGHQGLQNGGRKLGPAAAGIWATGVRGVTAIALLRLVVLGLPPIFVVASWFAGHGFPYYLDNNETFLSFVHARNLEIQDPWRYGWLTIDASDLTPSENLDVYTHNPNAPRYLHYLLLRAGIRELSAHLLILGLLGTVATVAVLWRLFGQAELLVVPLAIVLDYGGFLAWTVNTYRVWTFGLFFGMALAVTKWRPLWVGILTFCLFQVEYGTALFVSVTMTVLSVLVHGWQARRLIVALVIGAALSLGVFAAQVLAYYGWAGFVNELAITYARRGQAGDAGGLLMVLYHAWQGPASLGSMVAHGTHNPAVAIVTVTGMVFGGWSLIRGARDAQQTLLARLTVATALGMIATSALLYGYFVDAFVRSVLPLAAFLIAPACGVVALELRRILARRWCWPQLGAACSAAVLLPLILSSLAHFRPPLAADLFGLLQSDFRGRTIVAPNHAAHFADAELAFALTGGRGVRTSDLDATAADVRRLDAMRDPDGTLTYLCLDTVYLRWITIPEAVSGCDVATERMLQRGHTVVTSGVGWVIMKVNREDGPIARGWEGNPPEDSR